MTWREWWNHFRSVTFEIFVMDAFVLWIEVPYMEKVLGCKYHLQVEKEDPRTGWYKDGEWLTEEL